MPFVTQPNSEGDQPLTANHTSIFIGRETELKFFKDGILQPSQPAYNIVAISGSAGVGKTTLLNQVTNIAQSPNFKDYALTALVDNRQASPESVMSQFVYQLPKKEHAFRRFENALGHYREDQHQQHDQRDAEYQDIEAAAVGMAGAAIGTVGGPIGSFLRPIIGDPIKSVFDFFLRKFEDHQYLKDASRLDNPLTYLTQTFVDGLNHLTAYGHRILLFFDSFGMLAPTIAPWLLDTFLELDINTNVIVVTTSRAPVEAITPDGYKRWQPYHDNHNLYSISLTNFSEEETTNYLKSQGMTDLVKIHSMYQISHGLPYYLALLARNQQGDISPQKGLVENLLSRIPAQDQNKRQLVLAVALLTRPFNQDDLAAFPSLAGQDIPALYGWLIGQPFVRQRHTDGRYYYDDLAKELFCRALYDDTTNAYEDTRKTLAHYYEKQLEQLQQEQGQEAYTSPAWLELVLALVQQLLLLPDQTSHIQAIGLVTQTYVHVRQTREIAGMLHELSQNQPANLANTDARAIAAKLLQCVESDLASEDFLEANSYLLDKAAHEPSFSPELLATIYLIRGQAYSALHRYDQAMQDLQQAVALAPNEALTYSSRGFTYCLQGDYQRAIQDLDHAITLNPTYTWALAQRGIAHRYLNEYDQALADFNTALALNNRYMWAYGQRGKTYRLLKNYTQAIQDLNQAIVLNTKNAWAFAQRGLTHLWLNAASQAQADYTHAWQLLPHQVNYGWMAAWSEMCQSAVPPGIAAHLETIAATNPQSYIAHVSRGTAYWLRKNFAQAQTELDQAITLGQEKWDAHFWRGMLFASLTQDEDAIHEVQKALAAGLPPALLAPLHWFEQERPEFYQKYITPLM